MPFTLATWNINSVRLREGLVMRLLETEAPDILCLQEIKTPLDKFPTEGFAALGYRYLVARGQKGYNGVAILSKLPLMDAGDKDFAALGHARHVAARLENGVTIHNCYVPAGGDIPDREENVKFGQKLDYLTEMRDYFRWQRPDRAILVGDLNIAPREDDVWDHKALLKLCTSANCNKQPTLLHAVQNLLLSTPRSTPTRTQLQSVVMSTMSSTLPILVSKSLLVCACCRPSAKNCRAASTATCRCRNHDRSVFFRLEHFQHTGFFQHCV
jgi:exodeoxyribonuclease III